MVKEAQAHAADDAGRREVIELRNRADALIHSVEKTYNENRAKLGAESAMVELALEAAKKAVTAEDQSALKAATESLEKASHAMAEALYKAGQTAPNAQPSSDDAVKEGEVVDAEYAETK
jgi:molecular chaperone DnaK